MDFEEEQNKGFKVNVTSTQGKQGKGNQFDQYKNQNNQKNDYEEDIEEDIQSDQDNNHLTAKQQATEQSDSARGFGITVSQSLGIDKSVDSVAIDEYDHIESIEM